MYNPVAQEDPEDSAIPMTEGAATKSSSLTTYDPFPEQDAEDPLMPKSKDACTMLSAPQDLPESSAESVVQDAPNGTDAQTRPEPDETAPVPS